MSKFDYGAAWRSKQAARRALQQERRLQMARPVDLGDGCVFLGTRVDLSLLIKAGQLPQALTAQLVRVQKGMQPDIDESQMSDEDVMRSLKAMHTVVCASMVEPKVVPNDREELAEGEMRFRDMFDGCEDWIDKIWLWQLKGAPDCPVLTKDGEVELAELENFREGSEQQPDPSPGPMGEDLREATEPSAGDFGRDGSVGSRPSRGGRGGRSKPRHREQAS